MDLDTKACEVSRALTSSRTKVTCGDSVDFLWGLNPPASIDLVYLDSYDVEDWTSPGADELSAVHHLKELAAVLPKTRAQEREGPGTMIVVDDNQEVAGGGIIGKGRLVQEVLHGPCHQAFKGWQMGWICGGGRTSSS